MKGIPFSLLPAASLLTAFLTGCDSSVSAKKLEAAAPGPSVPPASAAEKPSASAPPAVTEAPSTATAPPSPMKKREFTVPSDAELRKQLTPLQWKVAKEEGTERPFQNDYWNNHEEGLYVCVVSGKPLFSSKDKFDSGTGWPSFTKPVDAAEVVTREDRSLFMTRTEARSKTADTHLGHVFDDGPAPTGLRYCMNSASLKFIPRARLAEEGYGAWLGLFEGEKDPAGR